MGIVDNRINEVGAKDGAAPSGAEQVGACLPCEGVELVRAADDADDKKARRAKKRVERLIGEKQPMSPETKKKLHKYVGVPFMILFASLLRCTIVRVFMTSPKFNFAPGGVTGICTMIEYKFPWISAGVINIAINIPLIILAFVFLKKSYAIKTAAAVTLASVGMILMKHYNVWQYADEGADPVLASVACGALGGIGIAIMIRAGGSNGGTDIIAAFIQRKFAAAGITWFIMALDCTVILSSYFVYNNGITPILMSAIQQFCSARMGDVILTGFKSAIKYEIITDDPEKLSAELIKRLKHSVTKIDAMGMYAHSERALLICVIHKRQVTDFNNILKKYPNTFAYVSSTNEVFGKFG